MRTPNTKCCICGKPMYRRPGELSKIRYAACIEHREQAKITMGLTDAQLLALANGRALDKTGCGKGRKNSKESKIKVAAAQKAWCAANPEKVKARGKKIRGAKHYNWKGGAAKINTSIRRMSESRRWINEVVRRDKACILCGSETDLEAHHVKPFATIVEEGGIKTRQQARDCAKLWDISNGVTLCEQCHCKHHGRKYTPIGGGRRKEPLKGRRSTAGSANPNYKGGLVSVNCKNCGKTFQVKRVEASSRKFCTWRCFCENRRKNVRTNACRNTGVV